MGGVDDEWRGRKILVAGAGGFLGRHLVRRLGKAGAEVLAVSRRSQGEAGDGIRWFRADLRNRATVRSIVGELGPEIVYQLCGYPDGRRDPELVLPTLESDVLTTVNLLQAAVDNPVKRFITATSLEEPLPGEPPSSPYAAAKACSAAYARMFHLLYQVPVVILRPFMTYGPGQPETKVVSYIIRSLLEGEAPKLSSGRRMVDWIYVDDVIDGFLAAGTSSGVEGATLDLGTGEMVSIGEVANRLTDLTASGIRPALGALPDRAFEQVRVADVHTTKLKLGWQAKVSLNEGLRMTVEWWKSRITT